MFYIFSQFSVIKSGPLISKCIEISTSKFQISVVFNQVGIVVHGDSYCIWYMVFPVAASTIMGGKKSGNNYCLIAYVNCELITLRCSF